MIKPSSCEPCPLFAISNGWILSEGQGTNGVVILGEAGGYHEYLDNLPFRPQAQSGSKLEEVFKIVSRETGQPCSRDQFVLYNVVNCNPPGDKLAGMGYEQEAISCCASNVDRVVGGFHTDKVKTILALGNIPLKFLTGVSGIAEEKQSVSYLRGYVLESKYGLVVPSYHPSYVRRGNGHLTPILVEDMKKALNVARGVYTNYSSHKGYTPPNYQVAPSLDEAWSFYYKVKDGSKLVLACDIETDQSAEVDEDERDDLESTVITLVQFSYEMCTGIALPCSGNYISIIEALLVLPNVKAGHNWWNFDSPRLRAKGFRVNGNIHDTMWMFKHWHPKLPRGLQSVASLFGFPFPWKHLYGANFQFYGCADVDAVQWILHHLPKLMKERGVWRGYYEHVYQVNPILDRASVGGIPVNDNNRVALEKDFKARRETIHRELQRVVPEEIRNIRPKRKDKETGEVDYGYIREPKIVGIEFENYQRLSEELRLQDKRVVSFEEFLWRKHNLTLAEFERVDRDTGERTKLERWAIVEEFKASSQQLIRYLEWKQRGIREEVERLREQRKGLSRAEGVALTAQIRELEELAKDYEVPTNLKTKRPTTSHKEIEEMFFKTGDEVLEMVSKIRSYDTNINNFIPNWKPSNGRVHTTYGYTAPQGQINSWRPNSQNCFSSDTEILTMKGWVKSKDVSKEDLVAQFDPETEYITFVEPLEIIKQGEHNKLLHISTELQIDMLVTLDHECLLKNRKSGSYSKYSAINYRSDTLQMQAGSYFEGTESLRETQVALICALQADGSIVKAPRLKSEPLIFTFSKKRKIERFRWAIELEGIPYREHTNTNDKTTFYIGANDVPDWLRGKKIFGSWITDLDYETLDIMAKEVFLWDGCYTIMSSYASCIASNADWVQIILLLTNRRARVAKYVFKDNRQPSYQVGVSWDRNYSLTTNVSKELVDYNDYVYCVSVPKGNIVTRRNGKVAITGNCSKHTEYGNEFRRIIEAPPGYCFIEADKKSFHVATMGYCANDRDYIRFSQIDPHSILGSYIDPTVIGGVVSLRWSDEDIKKAASEFKRRCKEHKAKDPEHNIDVRQELAKPTVLGNQLGLGAKKLQRQNRRFIHSIGEAERLQAILNNLFPKEEAYQKWVKEEAYIKRFLINEYGRIQYFYDVFTFSWSDKSRQWIRKEGDGARHPIAFRVQGTAFGMITDELLECERQELCEEHNFITTIHDSLMFMPEISKRDKCIESVVKIMNQPAKRLVNEATGSEGLKVGVEVSVGRNWKGYDKESNKEGMQEIRL